MNERGLLCKIESTSTLKIYNILGLSAGSYYNIKVRIFSQLTTGANVQPTVTIQTHYSILADPSIVDQINNKALNVN